MTDFSSVGLWDRHYAMQTEPTPYGDSPTYKIAADWVADCKSIEEWGCGPAWLKQFCNADAYIGVDGSNSPFADIIEDIATRETSCEGLVIRHVLEHNYNWAEIIDNAVKSFTKKLCVVLFTQWQEETHVLFTEPEYGDVPTIGFSKTDLVKHFPNKTIISYSGTETILRSKW